MEIRKAIILFLITTSVLATSQLDKENADRDLTSQITVLTDTPNASYPMTCQGLVYFGDGVKNLDGSGGLFELTITVGGLTVQPDPQIIYFSPATRSAVWTTIFIVPDNNEIVLKAKSPNTADTDVDVTAYLYDVGITDIRNKLPTNYIMGSSVQTDKDDDIDDILEDSGMTIPTQITDFKTAMDANFADLNDISITDVNTAFTNRLNLYDPPTKTEMDEGLASITVDNDAIAAAVWSILYESQTDPNSFGGLLQDAIETIIEMLGDIPKKPSRPGMN